MGRRPRFLTTLFPLKVRYPMGSHPQTLKRGKYLFLEQVLQSVIRSPAAERSAALPRAVAMINAVCLNHYSYCTWVQQTRGGRRSNKWPRDSSLLRPLLICHLSTVSSIFLNLSESPKGTGLSICFPLGYHSVCCCLY